MTRNDALVLLLVFAVALYLWFVTGTYGTGSPGCCGY